MRAAGFHGQRLSIRGVTMVELLIGMLIGLVTTVIIAQVLVASENRRRGTSSGGDAQVNGAVALYSIQRDLQGAGYGMSVGDNTFGCTIGASYNGTTKTLPAYQPLRITDGVAGAPDAITLYASSKNSYTVPTRLTENFTMPPATNRVVVNTTVGISPGDILMLVPTTAGSKCGLFTATSTTATTIDFAATAASPWNATPATLQFDSAGYLKESIVVNLGSFAARSYGVANETLQVTRVDMAAGATAATEDLFPNVVNLQAFYGKDTNDDGTIDSYNTTQPASEAAWKSVRTVRLAVVTRSVQWERDQVTTTQPVIDVGSSIPVDGAVACGSSMCLTMKVDSVPNWQNYRYKVYDTVVPLRNMIWSR